MDSLRDRNKEQAFQNLEKASEILQSQLRVDEAYPDLSEQFYYRADQTGCHRYFVEPYKSHLGSMVEQANFVSFPDEIIQQYNKVESASFMGIIPEIHRVWITVDNMLYLWNYLNPQQFDVYDGISEIIISVGLCTPKPGIFLETVKYLLVVATPIDISVLAICCDDDANTIRIAPTSYTLPSDNITMVKIIGSQSGRIFMAGNDMNLYELEYSQSDSVWSGIFGAEPVKKCRKINHFAWNWKLEHVVPPILRAFVASSDSLGDLSIDNARNVLYEISSKGILNAFHLGQDGTEMSYFVQNFDVISELRTFLGSRSISSDSLRKVGNAEEAIAGGFVVKQIQPVSPIESRRVHAVVILANGVRIYLGFVSGSRALFAPGSRGPSGLEILWVRSPPSPQTIEQAKGRLDDPSGEIENGSFPSFTPSQRLSVTNAFYSNGVYLMATEKADQPDELLCVFEDVLSRATLASAATTGYQPPCLKEGVSIGFDSGSSSGKVFDIQEIDNLAFDPATSCLRNLFFNSQTPSSDGMIRDAASERWGDDGRSSTRAKSFVPFNFGNLIASSTQRRIAFGVEDTTESFAVLGELCYEQIPSTKSCQRFISVLTNNGIHFFRKRRPSDVFYQFLTHVNQQEYRLERLFNYFGQRHSSLLSLGLMAGLPGDAGNGSVGPAGGMEGGAVISHIVDQLGLTAMSMVQNWTAKASYRALLPAASQVALRDTRLVSAPTSYDFSRSVAHDSLYGLVSRILRPIWLRGVIDRDGPTVLPFWVSGIINEIRTPLQNVREILLRYYPVAVHGESKIHRARNEMSVDGDFVSLDLLDRSSMQNPNSERSLILQAKAIEDASIRNLFMLVTRCCHALSLIEVFGTVQNDWKIQFDCSALQNFTFRSFIVKSSVHDTIKKVIQELIASLSKSDKTELADQAMNMLTSDAYHFFSAGDRYCYEATKCAEGIVKLTQTGYGQSMQQYNQMVSQSGALFLKAASYWNATEFVSGTSCELRYACASLIKLGPIGREAVVDLCLKTANNFVIDINTALVTLPEFGGPTAPWDANIYHGGSPLDDDSRLNCRSSCFVCLIDNILQGEQFATPVRNGIIVENGRTNEDSMDIVRNMVNLSVQKCDDPMFLEMLFGRLLDKKPTIIVTISHPFVETFLRDNSPQLLYSYYMNGYEDRPPKYLQAAELMYALATDDNDIELETRINYLHSAISSAKEAVTEESFNRDRRKIDSTSTNTNYFLSELQDLLEMAEYQKLIGEELSSDFERYQYHVPAIRNNYNAEQRSRLDAMQKQVQKLQYHLIGITELFNDICCPYQMWEMCLKLLYASKTTDGDLISVFWRSLIYRMVPMLSTSERAEEFLHHKRGLANQTPPKLYIDKRNQYEETEFENFQLWLPPLRQRIIDLGNQLNAAKNTIHFPVSLLILELEEMITTLRMITQDIQTLPRDYVVNIFLEIGILRGVLVESYFEVFEIFLVKSPDMQAQVLSTLVGLIVEWVQISARSEDDANDDIRYCFQSIRTGQMTSWIQSLKRHLVGVLNRNISNYWMNEANKNAKELDDLQRRIGEVTIIRSVELLR